MAYLAKNYVVVKASHIKTAPIDSEKAVVAITFDDAFVSVLKNAIPVLKNHRFTATIFVPTGNLGQPPRWKMENDYPDKYEIVMNEEEIVQLEKDGFEVLSHTVSHPNLTEIHSIPLQKELRESKQVLEKIVGHEVCGLSYPHGDYNATVCETARQVGYRFGFTIEPLAADSSPDDMKIGRFNVSPKDSLTKFKLKVSGAYAVVHYLRTIKRLLVGI